MPFYKKFTLRHLMFNRKARPDILMPKHTIVSPNYIKKMHKNGYKVFPWTIDNAAEAERIISAGADGIITNNPTIITKP